MLVAGLIGLALLEGITREELVWRPFSAAIHLLPIVMLLWRRTHPLLSVAVAWSVIAGLDIAAIAVGRDSPGLVTMVGLIVFPYALFRWGSGRDAVIGLMIMSVPHVTNMICYPSGPELTVVSFALLLLPSALGAAVRFRDRAQDRAIAEAKMFEREQLARELHDTIAHHVSAIAIQAQAGWTLAASDPEASASTLKAIKAEASRTLTEMRSIVGVLRRGEDEHSPQKRLERPRAPRRQAAHNRPRSSWRCVANSTMWRRRSKRQCSESPRKPPPMPGATPDAQRESRIRVEEDNQDVVSPLPTTATPPTSTPSRPLGTDSSE